MSTRLAIVTLKFVLALLVAFIIVVGSASIACAANFSTGAEVAARFGVHEIVLSGNGAAANPFDTIVSVRFTPPSGAANAKTVWAFYDGGDIWRARVYASEVGDWSWASTCPSDPKLDGKSGEFRCEASKLRGRLLVHPKNPRQWMTEDGRWFLNLNDTSYHLLSPHDGSRRPVPEADFQNYVKDAVEHGITSFRSSVGSERDSTRPAAASEHSRWDNMFTDPEHTRLKLHPLQVADERLHWMLDHYPDAYMQFILLPLTKAYTADETFWAAFPTANKERLLRYYIARYAAYPSIFWLIVNDCIYTIDPAMASYTVHKTLIGKPYPNVTAMAREVGNYFRQHDQWQHPLSTGAARTVPFPFGNEDWADYIHLEHQFDFSAQGYAAHEQFKKPVFLGEDRYEQDYPGRYDPVDMRYFQRRLFWSWLLSGGSANYGGRFWAVHPYSQTGSRPDHSRRSPKIVFGQLVGLDSVKYIRDYFPARGLELSDFEPAHELVKDASGESGGRAPRLMCRGQAEYLIYHPHATSDDRLARVQADSAARLQIDLRQARGVFSVEWFRALDGASLAGDNIEAGEWRELTAPWTGADVIVRLQSARGGSK